MLSTDAFSQQARPGQARIRDEDLDYPPTLPDNAAVIVDDSTDLLTATTDLREGVTIAKTPPKIEWMFYPQQNYPGKPWSNWGDGCVAGGKYYSAIGDHFAVGGRSSSDSTGRAFVYQYDPATRQLRSLVDISALLDLPSDHYLPGKVHSRIDLGSDGWLYYATHRGSSKSAIDANHYQGDWILRTNPQTGHSEIVEHGLIAKHSIPNSVLDSERMIFYGGTAPGPDADLQDIQFFAYDLGKRRLIYSGGNGPARYMILAKSTGRVYFVPGNSTGELMRFDPANPTAPQPTGQILGVRAATEETPDGFVYTASSGQRNHDAEIWRFNTRSEQATKIGSLAVGQEAYVASIDVDPSGRFLYYVPGAHGGGPRDGSPVVQYNVKTNQKKVLAFLHPFYQEKYGLTPKGTYSTAVSAEGDKLYVTWNVSRGTRAWDCCALTVIHIPESER